MIQTGTVPSTFPQYAVQVPTTDGFLRVAVVIEVDAFSRHTSLDSAVQDFAAGVLAACPEATGDPVVTRIDTPPVTDISPS